MHLPQLLVVGLVASSTPTSPAWRPRVRVARRMAESSLLDPLTRSPSSAAVAEVTPTPAPASTAGVVAADDGSPGLAVLPNSPGLTAETATHEAAGDGPGRVNTPGEAIRGLYRAFNERDAESAAAFLDENCIYEDLLLGPATVCRGKAAFAAALAFHPAFVTSKMFNSISAIRLPELELVVDSVAEGKDTVGVEWHVEVGGAPFPLGRGLTQAKIDVATGLITRVVDIAEAPWRVIGILVTPVLSILIALAEIFAFKY